MPDRPGQRLLRGFYSLAMYLLAPLTLYHLVWRGMRQPEYLQRWGERFGHLPSRPAAGALWVHAVSVGEVNAAQPLVNAFRAAHPGRRLVLTTVTPTGSARARALWGDAVEHLYLPYDMPGAVRRFLDHVRPEVGVIMETEIWPNLFCQCRDRGIPLLIANARLSARSLRGYAPLGPLVRMALAAVRTVAAQSEADARRYLLLGAPEGAVIVTGNLKYEQRLDPALIPQAQAWRARWGAARPVWVAASTHEEETEAVVAAHRAVRERHPDALLLWAPRHPERFVSAVVLAREAGFRTQCRSVDGLPGPETDCFVVDTLGELNAFYAAADVAFVGGSLQAIGGHNLLEPAALGVPAVVGPHTFNFVEVTRALQAVDAVRQVPDAAGVAGAVVALLDDAPLRRRMGEAGRGLVEAQRGALAHTLALVEALLPPAAAPPGA
ncbi:lipid IV(A) 3-deoxy-D-manno-octulosonic acid transferase [Coralloluteibacterium thermophilus]|uniref:3-deoxy-D-manno-octulosonic acid transferase n=1 Tax=Coralloluteibacterium thermophilum TaxID=2707049 RepID=A0ABV9NFQ0_9GAMM